MSEPVDSQPTDENLESVDPDAVDEDPEQCVGEEIPDPWDDEEQTDWPQDDEEGED